MSLDPRDPAAPRPPALRLALCAAAAVLALLYFGPSFVRVFRPPPDVYPDFVQEWLSARNFWAGDPPYSPQRAAMLRHTGQDLPQFDTQLPWNAHPPVAVLVALPFGLIADYSTAHLVWNLATFPLFVLSLVLLARELGIKPSSWLVCAAVALTVSWSSVLSQLYQGQLNFLILLLLVAAWIADRRGWQAAAGVAVGTAAAIKLFPALLLVYFVATGRRRAAVVVIATGLLLNLAALALFGFASFETYVRNVLPSLNAIRASWPNVSLTGYWLRVGASLGSPAAGAAVAVACQLAVVAAVWWVSRRAADAEGRDRAFALALVGMTLASPLAWTHYFLLLVLPLLLLWLRLPRGPTLWLLLVVAVVMWQPQWQFVGLLVGHETAMAMSALTVSREPEGGLTMALVGLGPFTYALVALFLLVGFARFAPAPVTRRSP